MGNAFSCIDDECALDVADLLCFVAALTPRPKVRFDAIVNALTVAVVVFRHQHLVYANAAAEQLRVSVALAMAANPTLRVLRILDGSLLDSDSLEIIATLAAENDYQVWIEIVDESGAVGFVIEDGAVRS